MGKLPLLIVTISIILGIVLVTQSLAAQNPSLFAHRDGCHTWHSCPSDTGSYVCGDLGYDDECPSKSKSNKEDGDKSKSNNKKQESSKRDEHKTEKSKSKKTETNSEKSTVQISTRFTVYENDLHKVRMLFPSDWEEEKEYSNSIVRFIAPGTGGETKPTGVLVTIFDRPDDENLDEFIDFFHNLRYATQSDFTVVSSTNTTLGGMEAREIVLYEQQDNVLDPKSDVKVMRVYAFDDNSHKGYALRYYSEPGLYNRYLPIAQRMFDSFEIIGRPHISSIASVVNNTATDGTGMPGNIATPDNFTQVESTPPFASSLGDGNNTIITTTVTEKTYTAQKFGISMKYPSDWTFVPEEEEFTSGVYDYSVMVPPGSAHIGAFCPTSYIGSNPKVLACQSESPVELGIIVRKLEPGTTLKDFYDKETAKLQQMGLIDTKVLETNKIKISGLSAIQTIDTKGGGSLGDLLESIGSETRDGKHMTVYMVNGSTGYQIMGGTEDEKDFDTYVPTIEKMLNSFEVEGATENPDNIAFLPDSKSATTEDVVLLSQRLKKGDGGYNDVIGQVKNIGTDTVEFVKIGLTVYDNNGDVMGTDSTYVDASTLNPNQKSSFDIISSKNNFEGMESYELSLQWRGPDGTDEYVDNAQLYKDALPK